MPARRRWIPEHKLMIVSHYGRVTADDLEATDVEALTECLQAGEGVKYLADFRHCQLEMTKEDVVEHARRMNEHDFWSRIPGLKVAMLAERALNTAFGLLFRTKAVDSGLQVFSTVDSAWVHLGLPADLLDEVSDILPGVERGA